MNLPPRKPILALIAALAASLTSGCSGDAPAPSAALEVAPVLPRSMPARELALTTGPEGDPWLVFLEPPAATAKQSAQLKLLHGSSGQVVPVASGPEIGPATIAPLEGGGVLIVWEASGADGRVLRARTALPAEADEPQLGEVQDLPTGAAKPLLPHAAALEGGGIGLVWQALEGTHYAVRFMRRGPAGNWSEPIEVSSTDGDAWRPRIASAPDGRVLVAYDRFVPGTTDGFDVMLAAAATPSAPFTRQPIATGPTYQGLPELGVDASGTTWITYEEAPSFGQGGSLRSRRQTRLVAVDRQGQLSHALLPQNLSTEQRGDFPRLLVTDAGLALTRRIPKNDYEPRSADRKPFYATWHTRVLGFDAYGEGHDLELDATDGENENDARLHLGTTGFGLYFASDQRSTTFRERYSFDVPIENPWQLFHASLPVPVGFPRLEPGPPPPLRQAWAKPLPQGLALTARDPRALIGDLHRHTDLSRCAGRQDGIALDAIRYARGPGALDFMALTDHFQHLTPASAWRQARDVERFHAPGSLVLLPGLERMIQTAGHQNLIFATAKDAQEAGLDTPPKRLPTASVIAIPHMSSMARNPFDWTRLDPDVQRLVEVHQGRRGSYEGLPIGTPRTDDLPGEPSWPAAAFDAQNESGWITRLPTKLAPDATPPGLISSSDHASSGAGFCGIPLAQDAPRTLTRKAIFQALLARQTFATTGPAPGPRAPHRLALKIQAGELNIEPDTPGLVSLAILENGREIKVLTANDEANPKVLTDDNKSNPKALANDSLPVTLVIRTHFGLSTERQFNISTDGATLQSRGFSQDRPELVPASEGATPPHQDTDPPTPSISLALPADQPAELDLLLTLTPKPSAAPTLHFALTWSKDRQPKLTLDLPLGTLQASPTRRFYLGPEGKRPYLDLELLPTPNLGPGPFTFPLEGRPKNAIYYVRATWQDGHHAWSRMVRNETQ